MGSPGLLTSGTSGPAFLPDEARQCDEAETVYLAVAWSPPSRGITEDLGSPRFKHTL